MSDRIAKVSITTIQTGERRFVNEQDAFSDAYTEHIVSALKSNKSSSFEDGDNKYMIVPYNPTVRVLCLGVTDIATHLQKFCDIIGYEFIPVAYNAIMSAEIDRYTAVCCFAHDPKFDDVMLEIALRTNCFYIGALGSKGYHEQRKERLREIGVSEDNIARIHSPIGLRIGSRGNQEIALSVISEIVKEFHERSIINDD
jgi:xanthine dehydrogenase accessory factor